jgi:thioredoxin reductase (NADPH)
VILATGVAWRRLEADGVDRFIGRGVLYGTARTEAPTGAGKPVFIIGGGNSADQAALFFADYASSVTMPARGEDLKHSMLQYLIDQIALVLSIRVQYDSVVNIRQNRYDPTTRVKTYVRFGGNHVPKTEP